MRADVSRSGHYRVELQRDNQKQKWYVHRLVMLAFVGPVPDGMECAHNNGKPSDNRLENLRYATRKENHADKKRHGTHQIGERNGFHKLTEEIVRKIRSDPLTPAACARKYGINQSHLQRIRDRKLWAHVV